MILAVMSLLKKDAALLKVRGKNIIIIMCGSYTDKIFIPQSHLL